MWCCRSLSAAQPARTALLRKSRDCSKVINKAASPGASLFSSVVASDRNHPHSVFVRGSINKMPETTSPLYINGFQNGYTECETNDETDTFLFTSESVGEGHPGEFIHL